MKEFLVDWQPDTPSEMEAILRFPLPWVCEGENEIVPAGPLHGRKCMLVWPEGHDSEARWVEIERIIDLRPLQENET